MAVRHLWSLVKPRIVALLTLTGTTAVLAAGGTTPLSTGGFIVAGMCIAGGSAALNCWYDRDIDTDMSRTEDRPLATGELSAHTALAFAVLLLATGTVAAVLTLPLDSVGYMWLGVGAYVGLYTILLKRRSRLGVVLGGSAGAFPVLAGWTAVRPLSLAPVTMAVLVFLWTPAHAWALAYVYRDEFAAVDIPTLPAVTPPANTVRIIWLTALTTIAAALAATIVLPPLYAVATIVGTPFFLFAYYRFYQTRTKPMAVRAFFTSNTFLAIVFLAWALPPSSPQPLSLIATAVVTLLGFVGLFHQRPRLRGIPASPPPQAPHWVSVATTDPLRRTIHRLPCVRLLHNSDSDE